MCSRGGTTNMTTHRSFTPEFKAKVVLEVLTGVRSASEACQHYQLKPDLVSRWKAQFLEGAATVFARGCTRSQAARFCLYLTNCGSFSLAKRVSINRSMVR